MHVSVTRSARLPVLRIAKWWRLNAHSAPAIFEEELTEAFALLAHSPRVGVLTGNALRPTVRRLSLKKSRQHLYYRVDEARQVVTVLQVWHQNRANPKL